MRDLNYISNFAFNTHFGLTAPLKHSEVKILAKNWLPQTRFHEKDLYHPIGLVQFLQQAETYTALNHDFWIKLYRVVTPPGGGTPQFVLIGEAQPPVAFLSHQIDQSGCLLQTSHDLDTSDISSDSYITCLRDLSYARSKKIYGSISSRNNYQMPRLPIVIIAEFRMLRDTLKHNILAHRDQAFPKTSGGTLLDAIRGNFLFGTNNDEWALLLELIKCSEKHDRNETSILYSLNQCLKSNGNPEITQKQWNVVRDFAFLEYYFIYAYNDTEYYDELSRIDSNEHEMDIEGCCLAFRREDIEGIQRYHSQSGRNNYLESIIKPYCLMTAAHSADNHLDGIRLFETTHSADEIRQDLIVWIALASHATYLDGAGEHNINAVADVIEDNALAAAALAAACILLAPTLFCAAVFIIVAAFDHFNDATDITSDDGPYTGVPGVTTQQDPQQDPQYIPSSILTTPLSTENNIYIFRPLENDDEMHTLAERSFPGKWGGHNGCIDDSPKFDNKTSRFYELLLDKGEI